MSKNFDKVKEFYDENLWTLKMVRHAVDRWITAEEFRAITGLSYP